MDPLQNGKCDWISEDMVYPMDFDHKYNDLSIAKVTVSVMWCDGESNVFGSHSRLIAAAKVME